MIGHRSCFARDCAELHSNSKVARNASPHAYGAQLLDARSCTASVSIDPVHRPATTARPTI